LACAPPAESLKSACGGSHPADSVCAVGAGRPRSSRQQYRRGWAYSEWSQADNEIRAFLRLSTEWSEKGYDSEWTKATEIANTYFDPDVHSGDEHVSHFSDSVDDLWPNDFTWMLMSSVIKDGVTAFEVYIEHAAQEILNCFRVHFDGHAHQIWLADAPSWAKLSDVYSAFGIPVASERVREVRNLRHFLTHQRGMIRSEEELGRFALPEDISRPFLDIDRAEVERRVPLRHERVVAVLDDMAQAALETEKAIEKLLDSDGVTFDLEEMVRKKLVELAPVQVNR